MSPLLAIDCPNCRVARETKLCGYQASALHARLLLRPRIIECRVCAFTERRGLFGGFFGPGRRSRAGASLTPVDVAARARDLLRERGASDPEIAAMRLVAA